MTHPIAPTEAAAPERITVVRTAVILSHVLATCCGTIAAVLIVWSVSGFDMPGEALLGERLWSHATTGLLAIVLVVEVQVFHAGFMRLRPGSIPLHRIAMAVFCALGAARTATGLAEGDIPIFSMLQVLLTAVILGMLLTPSARAFHRAMPALRAQALREGQIASRDARP